MTCRPPSPGSSGRAVRRAARASGALPGLARALGWLLLAAPAARAFQDPAAAPGAEPAAPERVLSLTLEDALRMALYGNLDLEIEELATASARYSALGSWGSFDPVLGVFGSIAESDQVGTSQLSGTGGAPSVNENTIVFGPSLNVPTITGGALDLSYRRVNQETDNVFVPFDVSTSDVMSLGLTQPLLRGGWRRYATSTQRESEILYERQIENERLVRQRMLLDVTNAYWDLVSAGAELGVRELAVALGEKQLQQDRRRHEVGTGTEVDVIQAQTNLAQQEQARIQAEFDLRSREDSLRRLLFQKSRAAIPEEVDALKAWDWPIEPLTPLPEVTADSAEAEELDWLASFDRGIRARPELWQSRLDIDTAEVRLQRTESERLPQLDLGLEASAGGFDEDPGEAFDQTVGFDFPTYTGSLTFSVPLGNRSAANAERAARLELRSARLAYDRMELDVLSQIRAAVRAVRFSHEAVTAAQQSLALARRQLAAEEARYTNGLSTTFQVLEFQTDLAEALSAESRARAGLAKSRVALEHAEGRIGDDLFQPAAKEDADG